MANATIVRKRPSPCATILRVGFVAHILAAKRISVKITELFHPTVL